MTTGDDPPSVDLLRTEWTLTRSQVRTILEESIYTPTGQEAGLYPIEMIFHELGATEREGFRQLHGMPETQQRASQWCQEAIAGLKADREPEPQGLQDYWSQLDGTLSRFIECNFLVHLGDQSREAILEGACALLSRLPASPLPLESASRRRRRDGGRCRDSWTEPSTNVIRIALRFMLERVNAYTLTQRYCDTVATLLDAATELLSEGAAAARGPERRALLVLESFLWAAWQQTVMLQFWYDSHIHSVLGYRFSNHAAMTRRRVPRVMPGRDAIQRARPAYMCRWAFELLRSEPSCVAQDFRRLFEIYAATFGDRAPRCNVVARQDDDDRRVCDGRAPTNCQRFLSAGVADQSAHDQACPRGPAACRLLQWDEESYRSVAGARAVSLEATPDDDGDDETRIRYCAVSGATMAITHVWSHGQGGRPETGFNLCLHRRYAALARSFGCTSYWMDTPCIPAQDELRDEAIGHINDNFRHSKLTVIVDRDAMEIAIEPLTLAAEETLLATLAVADWNVRAWTLLEGTQGRLNLHVLCRDNRALSLQALLADVLARGCLSLVAPCLSLQHFTRYRSDVSGAWTVEQVALEDAASLLTHRHASRDGDALIIWSLFCDTGRVTKRAVDFWATRRGKFLRTGFLISTVPRITGHRTLGWAPTLPNLPPSPPPSPQARMKRMGRPDTQFPAFNGDNSAWGTITAEGLRAPWLVCELERLTAHPALFMFRMAQSASPLAVFLNFYNTGETGDLRSLWKLRAIVAPVLKTYRWVALLLPLLRDRISGHALPPRPAPYQGTTADLVFAVVASHDRTAWEWQFVHEWDVKYRLPQFTVERDFLLV